MVSMTPLVCGSQFVTAPVVWEKLSPLPRVYRFAPCPMALIVPTAYMLVPQGTNSRTCWLGVVASNHGVKLAGVWLTGPGLAAEAGPQTPRARAPATIATNAAFVSFMMIFPREVSGRLCDVTLGRRPGRLYAF